jgi:hypothetical protein
MTGRSRHLRQPWMRRHVGNRMPVLFRRLPDPADRPIFRIVTGTTVSPRG